MTEEQILSLDKSGVLERLKELDREVRASQDVDFVRSATEEKQILKDRLDFLETREMTEKLNGGPVKIPLIHDNKISGGYNTMDNMNIRSIQKFITAGASGLDTEERSAITISGAGAVLPSEVFQNIITNEKYADLLTRATVYTNENSGTVKIPIISDTEASWKAEGAAVDPTDPTITSLTLGGQELMRAVGFSAAVASLSAEQFESWLEQVVAGEVVETLEKAFISGDGTETPHKGLKNLEDIAGTIKATTAIQAADLANAIAKLPVKYGRNAIIIANTNTALGVVGLFKGTNEYAYNLSEGAASFMNHEIIMNEYVADNEIYVVDPAQLYVRFASAPVVEVDRSAGFLSATNYMRCLTVVDFAWNPKAVAKVIL